MDDVGSERPEVEVPLAVGEPQKNRSLGRIGPQNLVEDGLEQQHPERIEHPSKRQQNYAGKPFKRKGKSVADEAKKVLHEGLPACLAQVSRPCLG